MPETSCKTDSIVRSTFVSDRSLLRLLDCLANHHLGDRSLLLGISVEWDAVRRRRCVRLAGPGCDQSEFAEIVSREVGPEIAEMLILSIPTDGDPPVSAQLRNAIARSGLSYSAIAAEAGIDKSQVSRFARGLRSLHLPAASRIAGALGVEVRFPRRERSAVRSTA